jgi:predicted TPR repeat methyltransferase
MAPPTYSRMRDVPLGAKVQELAAAFASRDFERLAVIATEMTLEYPTYQLGWKMLAFSMAEAGNLGASIEAYERAIALNSKDHECLNAIGCACLSLLEFSRAESYLRKAVQLAPGLAEPHYNLGLVLLAVGKLELAKASFRKAIGLSPEHARAHNNLGLVFQQLGQFSDSERSFNRAIECDPTNREAHQNLGLLLEQLGRFDQAIVHYRQALMLAPDSAELYRSLGSILLSKNNLEEAVQSFTRALAVDSGDHVSRYYLGLCYHLSGKPSAALESYLEAVRLNPSLHERLDHLIAALRGANPSRAPSEYVSLLFDGYGDSFESHLVDGLGYVTPKLISTRVRNCLPKFTRRLNILDLGCGSGLVGVELSQLECSIVGVDLSEKMLEIAKRKNCYLSLFNDDIEAFLNKQPALTFDVVVASDVFVYFGDLFPVFVSVSRVLKSGGLFAFSLEAISDDGLATHKRVDFSLGVSGRYAHTDQYVRDLATTTSFSIIELTSESIRLERNKPVEGYVVLLQKANEAIR